MVGGVLSRITITEKLQVARSPHGFVTVQLTVIVPTAKMLPEAGTHRMTLVPRLQSPPLAAGVG